MSLVLGLAVRLFFSVGPVGSHGRGRWLTGQAESRVRPTWSVLSPRPSLGADVSTLPLPYPLPPSRTSRAIQRPNDPTTHLLTCLNPFFQTSSNSPTPSPSQIPAHPAADTLQAQSGRPAVPGPKCFKRITVQSGGITLKNVQIVDQCIFCAAGGLDLSQVAFTRFAPVAAGMVDVVWYFE